MSPFTFLAHALQLLKHFHKIICEIVGKSTAIIIKMSKCHTIIFVFFNEFKLCNSYFCQNTNKNQHNHEKKSF